MSGADQPTAGVALKPCPFCGGYPVVREAVGETWVICRACNASADSKSRREVAIEKWNTRTPASGAVEAVFAHGYDEGYEDCATGHDKDHSLCWATHQQVLAALTSEPKAEGESDLQARNEHLRKSRDGYATMARIEFERRVKVSDVLIDMIERFERVDAPPEDKALIERASKVYADLAAPHPLVGVGARMASAFARIIDPKAWDMRDGRYLSAECYRIEALTKAYAVLALISPAQREGGQP